MSLRIVLVDDHEVVRKGLRHVLELADSFEVVGEAGDGAEALDLVGRLKPAVVVMDVSMPGLNGIESTRRILALHPGCKVVALSMHSERQSVLGMLEAGASAYVLKDGAIRELDEAIRAVASGQSYLSPKVAGRVVREYRERPEGEARATCPLTLREREVLQLIAEGCSNKDAAAKLHLSPKTVETHRRSIMEKLDLHNVAQLTRYAIREGIISPEV